MGKFERILNTSMIVWIKSGKSTLIDCIKYVLQDFRLDINKSEKTISEIIKEAEYWYVTRGSIGLKLSYKIPNTPRQQVSCTLNDLINLTLQQARDLNLL